MIYLNPEPGDIYYRFVYDKFTGVPSLVQLKFIEETQNSKPHDPGNGYTFYRFEDQTGKCHSVYSHHHNEDFYSVNDKKYAIERARESIISAKFRAESTIQECDKRLADLNALAVYPFEI